ncbi:MAG: hypothetical protein JW816_00415 [Candidatus Buchananbacteria bacterium]|nr:hypothetical protein [Candidatus Buchananbacteria bacterium]
MIVTLQAGIGKEDARVEAVVALAEANGLAPQVREVAGANISVTEVYLTDGPKATAAMYPEHMFRLEGVDNVRRVTPSAVSLKAGNGAKPHHVKVGRVMFGNDLPCQLIVGPCTVDRHIDRLVGNLVSEHGVKFVRGGCWKPRSSAYAFPGFGEQAVEWLLSAAKAHGVEAVFLEVIDTSHLDAVRRIRDQVGYAGQIVLWIGARTGNLTLLRALGMQNEFVVMLKNPIDGSIGQWVTNAEFVVAGERYFDDDVRLDIQRSLRQGNDQILFCARGVQHHDTASLYRFAPRHDMIDAIRAGYWVPVGLDPSHSAGTMVNDLVIRNLEAGLVHLPAFVLLEVALDNVKPLCDAAQAVPLSRLRQVQKMIFRHNEVMGG